MNLLVKQYPWLYPQLFFDNSDMLYITVSFKLPNYTI